MKTTIMGASSLLLVVTLYQQPYVLTFTLLLLAALWLFLLKSKEYVYLFMFVGIFGFLAEALAVYIGVWAYAVPQFLQLPLWLPVLWGLAGILIARGWNRLNKK